MTTLPDPNDRLIINKVMDRIFKRDEQLSFADTRLLEQFEGHAHRVMETTVNTVSRFTGLSVNIPDHTARRIVARGGTHLLSMDIQGPDPQGAVQGLGGVPRRRLSPVLGGHQAADPEARHGGPVHQDGGSVWPTERPHLPGENDCQDGNHVRPERERLCDLRG